MTWLYFVYTGTYLYIPRLTLYIPCVYTSNDNSVISCFRVVCCCWTMLAYILHAQYSAACSLKWKKTPVQTIRYVGLVHWCIYRYILHTAQYIQRYTILYLESGSSRLASPFCLGCLLVPCIARGVPLLHSLLDRQASKAGLAAPFVNGRSLPGSLLPGLLVPGLSAAPVCYPKKPFAKKDEEKQLTEH